MNLNQLSAASKVNSITISTPSIIHFVPDFGKTTHQMIYNSGIRLTNCRGVVTKSRMLSLGGKTFNARKLYLDTKADLTANPDKHKSMNVFQTLPKLEDGGSPSFIVIDHTITSEATQYIINQTNLKRGLFFMFQQLKKEFRFVKTTYPKYENVILFGMGSSPPEDGSLYHLLKILQLTPENELSDNFNAFDKSVIVSVNVTGTDSVIFPIMEFDKHGVIQIHKSNIDYIPRLYKVAEPTILQLQQKASTAKPLGSGSALNDLTKAVTATPIPREVIVSQDTVVSRINVNQKQLTKVLRKYKIKDRSIADNIKNALDTYLSTKTETVSEEDLENTILKAIHHTVFNTDVIEDEYLHNPAKLIGKLEEVNTYSKTIEFVEPLTPHLVSPKEMIGLERVTGLVRQEYEFSDNIHKNIADLFKSLESRTSAPIEIVNIKHEYQDTDLDRVINYEVTLQNKTGGHPKPYKVNMRVPALVNDRYFKLNGKLYILANQQFFAPITKTDHKECRLLSSYATMTVSIVNLKFNISELDKIIIYIQSHYPEIVDTVNRNQDKVLGVKFKDGTTIDLYGNTPYSSSTQQLTIDNDTGKLIITTNGIQNILSEGKAEYLYDRLRDMIKLVNPEDTLQKSTKSIPYLQVYISGIKLPLIIYLWQQLGLINALSKLGINFTIGQETDKHAISIPLKDGRYLYVYPESRRTELILNGLLTIDRRKYIFDETDLNDRHSIDDFILKKNSRATSQLDLLTENMIDPITKDLLEFHDKPTDVIGLITHEMIDKLLNAPPDSLTDLKIYRSRQAEIMFNLMYKNLMMAHNTYKREMIQFENPEAKLFLKENYVIECLLGVNPHSKGNSVLDFVQPYNPVAELKAASRLIKTGPQGIPSKRSFKKEHRNIHPSYYGNIGANATSEYSPVGIVNHLTLTPLLSNRFGSFGGKDITRSNGWDIVSLEEALVPFINEIDATRAILAYTHRSQVSPIRNGEVPIVATGAEYVIPQLSSDRFIQTAKEDGEIMEVKNDSYIKVKYKNRHIEYVDITPRLATTKRASYIHLGMDTLEPGTKFTKNQPIAWSHCFDGSAYTPGKNLKMALMNYLGYSHEDGYVISSETAGNYQTEIIEEISTIIPPNAKITQIVSSTGKDTQEGDILVEFTYMGDLDDYIEQFSSIDQESDENEIAMYRFLDNKIQLRSTGGEISQIRVYVNNKNVVDPTVIELWKKITDELKTRRKLYETGAITQEDKLSSIDNLDMSQLKTGTHKYRGTLFEGTRVAFYIKKVKTLNPGDKMANRYGGKGVVTKIIDADNTPKGEFTGDLDIFLSPIGVLGRKNVVVVKELYLGKIFYYLTEIVAKKAESTKITTKMIRDLILSIYDQLDATPDRKMVSAVKKKFNEIPDTKFRKMLSSKELKLNLIVEPFTNISMDKIKNAAELLGIPLDERVFIPELGTWTKNKVPVGLQYMNTLEQLASDYESLRSTGGYIGLTGQPKKGRVNMGGQSLGNLDIYTLLSFDCPAVLEELMTIRSDDFNGKRQVVMNIIQNGEASIPKDTGDADTQNIKNIHLLSMGLQIE